MQQDYSITIAPDETQQECEVVLRGPGIAPDGRRYVFANTTRCAAFAEADNFAYRQGFHEGYNRSLDESGEPLLVISGSTPEGLRAQREPLWQRLRRTWRLRQGRTGL